MTPDDLSRELSKALDAITRAAVESFTRIAADSRAADDAPPTGTDDATTGDDAPTTTPVDESGGPRCDHTEPGTPCDWDRCAQPERLAQGDRGGVPPTPTLDALRAGQPVWRGPIEGYGTGEMIGILDSDPSTWGGVSRQWGPGDPPNPPIGQGRQYCSPMVNAACPGHDEPPYCDQDPASPVTMAAPPDWADTQMCTEPYPCSHTAPPAEQAAAQQREADPGGPTTAVTEQPTPVDMAVAAELRSIADALDADAETYPGAGANWHNGVDHAIQAMRARADWMDHGGDERPAAEEQISTAEATLARVRAVVDGWGSFDTTWMSSSVLVKRLRAALDEPPATDLPTAKQTRWCVLRHDHARYGCTGPDPQES